MHKHLLSISNLSVSFHTKLGEIKAVRNVNLFLDNNEILAIVGESGCGKSVTLQTIMRLLPSPPMKIANGEIIYDDIDIVSLSEKEMLKYRGNEFSMIFQDSMSSLNPTMSIGNQMCEGIIFHKKYSKAEAWEASLKMLSHVKLPDPDVVMRRYSHTLSGGQRQRIMIAMAIACKPKILLADEPTTSLDTTLQAHILETLKELRDRNNMSIILVTHDLRVVARVADRIAIMYAGSIIETGTVEQIFNEPSHPYTWGLLCSLPDKQDIHKSKLYSIGGHLPEPREDVEGCSFATRCEYAMSVCDKAKPANYLLQNGHTSSCWLLDSRAPIVKPPQGITLLRRSCLP